MKPIYDILTAIADRHLAIPTLLERRSDTLDFHEVSVWGVKDALWYAYQAGVSASAQSVGPAGVLQEAREALVRAEFLMRRVYEGDHRALENLPSAAKQARAALAAWAKPDPTAADAPRKPYSVLLLYPDHANDSGIETYYAFVEAPDPIAAVALAQRNALAVNEWTETEPDDFAPLLVTQGHHPGEALFNK